MKLYATLLFTACAVAACDKPNDASTTNTTSANLNAADNTRLNARDKAGTTVTPIDQGNNQADIATTQAIRKAVMADDSLSSDAKNVKIITNGGVITLRGPVANAGEKSSIEAKAMAAGGSNRVDDLIEVKTGN